jgi:hypothetical protein
MYILHLGNLCGVVSRAPKIFLKMESLRLTILRMDEYACLDLL